jgi:hypothetical protein
VNESKSTDWQREMAGLFLLALLAAFLAFVLGWGRIGGPKVVPYEPSAPPDEPDRFLPERAAAWSVDPSVEDASALLGLFLDALTGSAPEEPPPVPAALTQPLDAPVFVTVYATAGVPLRVRSRARSLADTVRDAAGQVRDLLPGEGSPAGVRVRMDVVREVRTFPLEKRIIFAEQTLSEPFGMAVGQEGDLTVFLPGDIQAWEVSENADTLVKLCRDGGLEAGAWREPELRMWRLDTVGFVNDAPGSRRALFSPRGLVSLERAGPLDLLRACALAGDFITNAQQDDGSLLAYLAPGPDLTGGCDSLTVEASAAGALGALCEFRTNQRHLSACGRALARAVESVRPLPGRSGPQFASRPETCYQAGELEQSAQVLEAMCRYRRASGAGDVDPWIGALASFLLVMQVSDGSFRLALEDEAAAPGPSVAPATAVRARARAAAALALSFRELAEPDFLYAARRAMAPLLEAGRVYDPEEARWVVTALLELNHLVPDAAYVDAARRIVAQRREMQITDLEAPAEDLVGGTLAAFPPRAEDTANDLVVFASACMMEPDGPSGEAAELAARYLMALQILPENSYYLRRPEEAMGGFRERPGLDVVRLHAVDAALRGMVLLARVKLREASDD